MNAQAKQLVIINRLGIVLTKNVISTRDKLEGIILLKELIKLVSPEVLQCEVHGECVDADLKDEKDCHDSYCAHMAGMEYKAENQAEFERGN